MSENSHRRSAVSTALVMACTMMSRILGFLRTAIIGALFGAGGPADVILLVFNIPNNLRKLLAEGALSTAFIPELSRQVSEDPNGKKSRDLARSILGLQSLIIIPILALSIIFPDQVLRIFETFDDPVKRELSRSLFRWMMPYILLVSFSALMMAVQNTHERFFVPASTPVIFSISVISALVFGYRSSGAHAIAYGVLAGGIAQILVQYPSYRRLGYSLLPLWNFSSPPFRQVMRSWVPILLTSSLFAINNQVAMLLASGLPDKSASTLSYAIVFFQLPFGVFSASISTVLYPAMSRQAAAGNRDGLTQSLNFGYRHLWALLVPSAMAMTVSGEAIIAVAFQRGAFSWTDTQLTARVLSAYSLSMPFMGIFTISQRAFYALRDTRRPFYSALLVVALDIILSLIFVFGFRWGSWSLALANSLAFICGSVLQFSFLRRHLQFSLDGNTLRTFLKVLFISAAALVLILIFNQFIGNQWWSSGSNWKNCAILMALVLIVASFILGLYFWMKVEVVSILFKRAPLKNRF